MKMISYRLEIKARKYILDFIQRWDSQGSGWMIDYIEGHYLNVSKCNPLEGKSYIPLPKELQHHSKGLINSSRSEVRSAEPRGL